MPAYAVYSPAPESASAARTIFVKDGFCWPAFLFGPFWLLARGLWLALVGWLLVVIALLGGAFALGLPPGSVALMGLALAVLLGLEAPALRALRLRRRGLNFAGMVHADTLDDAEALFFARAPQNAATVPPGHTGAVAAPGPVSAPFVASPARQAGGADDVIGLFPRASS